MNWAINGFACSLGLLLEKSARKGLDHLIGKHSSLHPGLERYQRGPLAMHDLLDSTRQPELELADKGCIIPANLGLKLDKLSDVFLHGAFLFEEMELLFCNVDPKLVSKGTCQDGHKLGIVKKEAFSILLFTTGIGSKKFMGWARHGDQSIINFFFISREGGSISMENVVELGLEGMQ
jgi:hypothetical protein